MNTNDFFFFYFFFWASIMLILRVWLLRKLCDCKNVFVWSVTTHTQLCKYCPLWAQRNLMTLKCVYKVKGPILIRLRTLSPIWCRTSQTPPSHADTTSLLCLMRLRGQTNKHPSLGQTNKHSSQGQTTPTPRSKVSFNTICNNSCLTMWILSALGPKVASLL